MEYPSNMNADLPKRPRYHDAWLLLGDLCDAVAYEKDRTQVKVRFIADQLTYGVGFCLQAAEKEQRFLIHYMYLHEPKPEEMPDSLWEVFRLKVQRMHDLAELIEQGVARADLTRKLFEHDLREAQAAIASRHMAPLELLRPEQDSSLE